MNTSHEITVLRMIMCAIEETVGRRLADEEPEPFDTLVSQYGKGVGVTPEMARPLMVKPLSEVFGIQLTNCPAKRPIDHPWCNAHAEISIEQTEEQRQSWLATFGVGESLHAYQNPDGSYTHETRFHSAGDDFPVEIKK